MTGADPAAVYRAPMRARDRDVAPGVAAERCVEAGLVGIGDALRALPASLEDAVTAAAAEHGPKAGALLRRFTDVPDGAFVWTRESGGVYRLGRISGPWRYDDSAAARADGVCHVRPADWLEQVFDEGDTPAAVLATFARGGRNFQRTHDAPAERQTAERWAALRPPR
jgi:hypothetical protein